MTHCDSSKMLRRKQRLLRLMGAAWVPLLVATLPLGPALAQSGATNLQVALVRQDFSDCGNHDVQATDPSRIGGTVSISQAPGGATNVTARLGHAAPNTTYQLFLKCVRQLGSIRTDATGAGSASFNFQSAAGSASTLTFDMYPAGAPAGNKYQSARASSQPSVPDYVARFAPELRMDRAAVGFPMSAQAFYQSVVNWLSGKPFQLVENLNKATLGGGSIPTYYQVRTFGTQTRVHYWWFYGYQHPCFANEGAHNGDWEHVMLTLKEDRTAVAAVTYYQHNGSYTRISGPRDAPCTPGGTGRCGGSSGFAGDGAHPVVYSGKIAHGSYHDNNVAGPAGVGGCAYYGDFRNPASPSDYLQTWRNLIDLDQNQESWIAADRTASWSWGPDGISNHPTQHPPANPTAMCEGSPTYLAASDGCYKSECLAGDDEASEDCLKECKPGYDNAGLTCNKGIWPWEWSIYGRLTGGNKYNYNFAVPLHDAGLTRRRNTIGEWDLP